MTLGKRLPRSSSSSRSRDSRAAAAAKGKTTVSLSLPHSFTRFLLHRRLSSLSPADVISYFSRVLPASRAGDGSEAVRTVVSSPRDALPIETSSINPRVSLSF